MLKEHVEKLEKDFPQIFQDLYGDMHVTCMAWGVDTGDGWFDLIYKLCEDIMALDPGPDFKAAQIKEKFGGLRFYVDGYPADEEKSTAIGKLISEAENKSYKICEWCGSTDNITTEGGWLLTLCRSCREDRAEQEKRRLREQDEASLERKKRKEERSCKICPDCNGTGIDKNLQQRYTTGGHNDRSCERCGGECHIYEDDATT